MNPGGKLPLSWPRTAGSEPLYYNHNLTHEPEDRPTFTSRYWDVNSKPLYPFGYGLSYTTFKFTELQLSKPAHGCRRNDRGDGRRDKHRFRRRRCSGAKSTFISATGSASRPVRQLKGFQRVSLQPGETRTLKFPLGKDELQFWSPQDKEWAVERAEFDIWAGEDSTASLHAEFKIVP